nr:MAG TPA: hypothetical protein [Bacteriophage sp.]
MLVSTYSTTSAYLLQKRGEKSDFGGSIFSSLPTHSIKLKLLILVFYS